MKIIVCIKPVLNDLVKGNKIVRRSLIVNPYDMKVMQCVLELKKRVSCAVICLSMGPKGTEDVLRRCLAMGADEAILLNDQAFSGSDTYATTYILAAAIKKLQFADLIVCGEQTIDGETGQVSYGLAQRIGRSSISGVTDILNLEDEDAIVKCNHGEHVDIMRISLPSFLVCKGFSTVYPELSLMQLKQARLKPIKIWGISDLELESASCGQQGSKTKVVSTDSIVRCKNKTIVNGTETEIVQSILHVIDRYRKGCQIDGEE